MLECGICLEEMNNSKEILISECNHKFHKMCICNVKICPYCRKVLKEKVKEKVKGNIKVCLDRISIETCEKICEYYNKRETQGELKMLDRFEGGFCVEIKKIESDLENEKIRQLRWSKKCLVSDGYIGLLDSEVDLLYESMENVLGVGVVSRV